MPGQGIVGEVLLAISSAPSNLSAWCKLFMLARCVLANPVRGGRSHWRNTLNSIRCRIRRWKAGAFNDLWSEVLQEEKRLHNRRKRQNNDNSQRSQRAANARRARHAVGDDQYRKAIQALASDVLALPTVEVVDEMLSKHPQVTPPSIPADSVPPPAQIAEVDIVRALKSFPAGTAPGPSSLRANHIKEAVFCPSPDRANYALRSLVRVVNLLCAVHAPSEVVPYLCGATLFACKKKRGGVRPIAVGEVLRRLTSKCISRAVQAEAIRTLVPLQVGVGISAGCEAIVHSVTCVVEESNISPDDRWTLLLMLSTLWTVELCLRK